MHDPAALRFRWEQPVPGDRWNYDSISLGATCVRVGRIRDGQVIARIFRGKPLAEDEMFGRERFSAKLVHREGDGGCSSKYLGDYSTEDQAMDLAEDFMFGALRDWITCRTCGCLANLETRDEHRLRAAGLCFLCDFWHDKVAKVRAGAGLFAVVNGRLYNVGPEGAGGGDSSGRGHGGRRFDIRWRDGRRVVSTNLWSCGDVPPHFRDQLPDDADFA